MTLRFQNTLIGAEASVMGLGLYGASTGAVYTTRSRSMAPAELACIEAKYDVPELSGFTAEAERLLP